MTRAYGGQYAPPLWAGANGFGGAAVGGAPPYLAGTQRGAQQSCNWLRPLKAMLGTAAVLVQTPLLTAAPRPSKETGAMQR